MNTNIILETSSETINDVLVFTRTEIINASENHTDYTINYSSLTVEEKQIVDNFKTLLLSKI